jgi:hypothetical protein
MASYPYRLPRKYRYRPRGKISNRDAAVVAVIIAVAAASAGTKGAVHHGKSSHAVTADVVIPGGSDLGTPAGWAHALLAAEGDPQTTCNLSAVTEWERREGGGFGNQASYNALNVNPGAGANWPGHPAIGAWAFPDAQTGLRYTVATLSSGYYDGIRAALRAGNSAQAVCDAIMASPWAASHYDGTMTATC